MKRVVKKRLPFGISKRIFIFLVAVLGLGIMLYQWQIHQSPLLTGKVHKINADLGIVVTTEDERLNNATPSATYYEAGTYRKGPYTGYKRYVVIREGMLSFAGYMTAIVASKDEKTYVYDGKPEDSAKLKNDGWENPVYGFDTKKIAKIDRLPSSHDTAVPLDSTFALHRNQLLIDSVENGKTTEGGYPVYDQILVTDFSSATILPPPTKKLTFYAQRRLVDGLRGFEPPEVASSSATKDAYIAGTTQVLGVDETGLGYSYDLIRRGGPEKYQQTMQVYEKAVADKKDATAVYPDRPSLAMENIDITTEKPLYKSYSIAVPQACASDVNTLITQNITDDDLQNIGMSLDGNVYALRDENHPLYVLAHANKTSMTDEEFKDFNNYDGNGEYKRKPTYEEYVSKNPLLFIKDPWSRWVILGEYDIKIGGGCGKPVVYLYPEKPTDVSVQFMTKMQLDVAIPSYKDKWFVRAYPNGTLYDLQPEYTDCSQINVKALGSEYAKDACLTHSYPYLYWAGKSLERSYPDITKGWVVARSDVSGFLDQTLTDIGFSQNEKTDFLSYWVPHMLQKQAPYYRIAFLQTHEMNQIAPMKITPMPTVLYRLFLDYKPLVAESNVTLQPQALTKIQRKGFTVVEWGGLKQ